MVLVWFWYGFGMVFVGIRKPQGHHRVPLPNNNSNDNNNDNNNNDNNNDNNDNIIIMNHDQYIHRVALHLVAKNTLQG